MSYNFGFVMDQIAGHITNYHNLRSVANQDPELNANWHEIYYYIENGKLEKFREKFTSFVPTYYTGIMRATWEMHKALRHQQYDAMFSNASVSIFFTHKFRKTPTLLDFDSTPRQIDRMESYGSAQDSAPIAYVKYKLSQRVAQSATILQAWSNWAKDSMVKEYGIPENKVVVNPPGVDLQYWQPHPELAGATSGEPLRVLFVGGDFQRKGGQLLLEWYKSQSPDKVELHLVTREEVESGPGIYVYNDMQPNTPELLNLYQRSDLFVLPSLGECFGIANVEAMASGLPVVASDVGGIADIIEPGRNGFIVPSNDVKALSQAINNVLENENLRQQMRQQSRLLAEQRFDLQHNARRTFGYMKQIAAHANVTTAVAV